MRDQGEYNQAGWAMLDDGALVVVAASASRALASSRSARGLLSTRSNVNRFLAETGGQFRISMTSSCRSSEALWETLKSDMLFLATYGSFRREPSISCCALFATEILNLCLMTLMMLNTHLVCYFVENPSRNSHRRRFIHEAHLCHNSLKDHGRHVGWAAGQGLKSGEDFKTCQ
jgi:hypothetical protein